MRYPVPLYLCLLSLCATGLHRSAWPAEEQSTAAVDFENQVRPILLRSCVECHGAEKQEGGLRLDQRAHAMQGGDSGQALRPGSADESELIRRMTLPAGDPEIMPAIGDPLSPAQIDVLRRWIDEGAEWPDAQQDLIHWAYQSPRRPQLPDVNHETWPVNEPFG